MTRASASLGAATIVALWCAPPALGLETPKPGPGPDSGHFCGQLAAEGLASECGLGLQVGWQASGGAEGPGDPGAEVDPPAPAGAELPWARRAVALAASPELRSLWVELLCFLGALAAIRLLLGGRRPAAPGGKAPKQAPSAPAARAPPPRGGGAPRALESLAARGRPAAAVVEAWRREKAQGEVQLPGLRAAVKALAAAAPEHLVEEVLSYLERPGLSYLAKPQTLHLLVDAAASAGRPDLGGELSAAAARRLGVAPDERVRDALLNGHAACGDEQKVEELLAQWGAEASARRRAAAFRGFLKGGHVAAAVRALAKMHHQGLELPPKALAELFGAAFATGAAPVALGELEKAGVPLPAECLHQVLGDCVHREDLETGRLVERLLRAQQQGLTAAACEMLVKLHACTDDARGVELFRELQESGVCGSLLSEGLCVSLLAKCAESKNLRLADAVAAVVRERKMVTLSFYKTLMKLYACCGLFDKACDLYGELVSEGLEPDSVMYGCLVKFSVKCRRTELSEVLFEKAGGGYVQNYMWLIRSAGQDGDVARAIRVLRRLEEAQPAGVDVMVYNSVLDVCVSHGGTDEAKQLLEEMTCKGVDLNLVTYNTLMKGHSAKGDLPSASAVMRDIKAAGLSPDAASYNCLISAAVTAGNVAESLRVLDTMERQGVPIDMYTVSIIMKAVRRASSPREAERALSLLDRSRVDVCEDEVLFNTVLDACIYRVDRARLSRALAALSGSRVRPSVRTYGLLIKACSVLRQTSRCWAFWQEMVVQRGLEPNDITLSCMIDALVEGKQVEDAVGIFQQWKSKANGNTVIYSTLIKGFASTGDADRAMATMRDMQAEGVKMNIVAYTALIDAHARSGSMQEARRLLELMEQDGCQPNTITYSNLVKGHCVQGDLQQALSVFNEMLQRGIRADTVIFNTMLDGCVRHGHFQLADKLLEDMQSYSLDESNFTLSIVVKMWGKRRDLDRAFAAVRAALRGDRGRRVDPLVGACLVGACLHNHNPDRALEESAGGDQGAAPV
ncbi:unnamed protein product [Prorocentrum cordatum]|uniref:Pentacotripeptide-repeat region of PRORP domain-containing protein n=1 Tax=Prorocentrum cordatum TaxID=2364126 RepID=A0ABN9S0T4_9DINO|nr:unnamed protein product [Polarella glacialis]